MKKGFTLIEILVVVLIIGTLAGLLLPRFTKARRKVSQRQAEDYLRSIRIAQKMYYARNATYACTSGCANAAAINDALGTGIRDTGGYVFSLSATASTFTANADASGSSDDLTLNQNGDYTLGGGAYTPPYLLYA